MFPKFVGAVVSKCASGMLSSGAYVDDAGLSLACNVLAQFLFPPNLCMLKYVHSYRQNLMVNLNCLFVSFCRICKKWMLQDVPWFCCEGSELCWLHRPVRLHRSLRLWVCWGICVGKFPKQCRCLVPSSPIDFSPLTLDIKPLRNFSKYVWYSTEEKSYILYV